MLRPDMPVRYTYVKEGDRMMITKVTLEKPISYYKKRRPPRRPRLPND